VWGPEPPPARHQAPRCRRPGRGRAACRAVALSFDSSGSSERRGATMAATTEATNSREAMLAEANALVREAAALLDLGLARRSGPPPLPFAHMNRGLAAAELGDHAGAVRSFELCLGANAALVRAQGGSSGGDALDGAGVAGVLNSLGVSLRQLGRDDDALAAWQLASAGSALPGGGGSGGGQESYEVLANAAGLLADRGDFEGALAAYGRARALAPESAEVVNNVGFLHERRGDFAAAAAHYREALRLLGFPAQRHAQIEANLRLAEARLREGDGGSVQR